jgi:hypothetical protein
MNKNRYTQIGLDRLVRLDWLKKTASLVLSGNDAKAIKTILQDDLKGMFLSSRKDVRGSLDKTITILLKIWLTAPQIIDPLRVEGLELLNRVPRRDHLAVHWGMVTAVYPFWLNVAAQTGRLLRLQGSATAAHVQRRVREQYGERETVSRRTRYVLRSYLDWGVLQETGKKGIYSACPTLSVENQQLIVWLIEASLLARTNGSAPLRDLFDSPSLFPFSMRRISAEHLTAKSPRLELLRHGLDEDLIMLRRP